MENMSQEKDYLMLQIQVTVGEPIGMGYGAITAGETDPERQEQLAEKLRDHIVPVSPDAPSCCIDGRKCVHTLANGETTPRPSMAGGPVTAYAAAELTGWFGNDNTSSSDRFDRIDTLLNAAGLPTGTHIDQTAEANKLATGKTGCGADDLYVQNVDRVAIDSEAVEGFTKQLMGDQYNSSRKPYVDRAVIQERNADWNPTHVVNKLVDRDPGAVEVLISDDTPTHGHNESLVVFTYLEDMTIDRDAFFEETGQEVFVVDISYIDKVARALASGPNAEEQYSDLKHAMVAYQIGTYLSLCDGSQRPVVLTPAA